MRLIGVHATSHSSERRAGYFDGVLDRLGERRAGLEVLAGDFNIVDDYHAATDRETYPGSATPCEEKRQTT